MHIDIHTTLADLVAGDTLPEQHAEQLFTALLAGNLLPEHIAAILAIIQYRSPTVEELVGGARAMRAHVTPVQAPNTPEKPLIDTCGTGGAPKTFNVSTAAAIVAASTQKCSVCKHGNRSRTGRGSAEVLQQLGVNIDASPTTQTKCLEHAGVCFSFAIRHHPAMVHAAPVRKALAFPTIFNLLGPLTNPANAQRQLLGVYHTTLAEKIAHALAKLDCTRAIIAHSHDNLDELSISAPTTLWTVNNHTVTTSTIDPRDLNLPLHPIEHVRATSIEHAADMVRAAIDPDQPDDNNPPRDMVILSASAALVVADQAPTIESAIPTVRQAINDGNALQTLHTLAEVSHA